MNKKVCPLTQNDCNESDCAWWASDVCAVKQIAILQREASIKAAAKERGAKMENTPAQEGIWQR